MTTLSRAALGQTCGSNALAFSRPAQVDLSIYRGDSGRMRVTITHPDGTPIPITAATWDCDIRYQPDDPDPVAVIDVVPVAGESNQVDLVLTHDQSLLLTQDGFWDLEMTMHGVVTTLLHGKVKLTKDVSRP